jgi:hypothetical protein
LFFYCLEQSAQPFGSASVLQLVPHHTEERIHGKWFLQRRPRS